MIFRARTYRFSFPGPTLLMGVVNVTPDSFSDGGKFLETAAAVDLGLKLIGEGADIIDIGGESTRPGALPVPENEELRRVIPVIEALRSKTEKPISIDTMKPVVAEQAIAAGASIVNDVAANRMDPEMWRVVARNGAGYVLMHMQGTPQTMQENPKYDDVTLQVKKFFQERMQRVTEAGVSPEQVVLDVGIGFGKTAEHNLQLLRGLHTFKEWDRPLLVGVSRKAFIGAVLETKEVSARLPGSLACACWAVAAGVQMIRTHDVAATRAAVRMSEAIIFSAA